MTDSPSPNPVTDLDGFLSQRYPTFAAVVLDLRNSNPEPKLRQWTERVRQVSDAVVAESKGAKSSKVREESEVVVRGFEVAASIAVQFALKPR